MTVLFVCFLWGILIAGVKPGLGKPLFMVWLIAATVVVMPMILMPGGGDLPGGSAFVTIPSLPISLGLGWIVGRIGSRLTRRAA